MTTFEQICVAPDLDQAIRQLSMDQLSEVSELLEGRSVSCGIPTLISRHVSDELESRFSKLKNALKRPRIEFRHFGDSIPANGNKTHSHSSAFQYDLTNSHRHLRNA